MLHIHGDGVERIRPVEDDMGHASDARPNGQEDTWVQQSNVRCAPRRIVIQSVDHSVPIHVHFHVEVKTIKDTAMVCDELDDVMPHHLQIPAKVQVLKIGWFGKEGVLRKSVGVVFHQALQVAPLILVLQAQDTL